MDNLVQEQTTSSLMGQRDCYSILDVPKNASQMMIREAYVQQKSTYAENNPAFYSLGNGVDSHRQENLLEIERAYAVLMDPEKRELYNQDLIQKKYATIHDFHPPLQRSGATAYVTPVSVYERKPMVSTTRPLPSPQRRRVCEQGMQPSVQEKYEKIIAAGDPADGQLYRLLRETAQITLDQMHVQSKIRVEHFLRVEDNQWDSLPDPIYTKGFLHSYFEFLGVKDPNRLVDAFITRFENWKLKETSKS